MELRADVVAPKQSQTIGFNNNPQITQILCSELQLWRRQAKAIGRSPNHLKAIDRLLEQTQSRDFLEVSRRTYQVRHLDLEEFNRRALELMESGSHWSRWQSKLLPLTRTLKIYCRRFEHWIQTFVLSK
jgi:inactivated superfamily I helicase